MTDEIYLTNENIVEYFDELLSHECMCDQIRSFMVSLRDEFARNCSYKGGDLNG